MVIILSKFTTPLWHYAGYLDACFMIYTCDVLLCRTGVKGVGRRGLESLESLDGLGRSHSAKLPQPPKPQLYSC